MKKNITRFLFGILFILTAILLLGNSAGWWSITNFSGWWTFFLIVPGIAGLISCGFNLGSFCMVLIGGWMLASAQHWIPKAISDTILLVVILLLIGLELIFGSFKRRRVPSSPVILEGVHGASDTSNSVEYTAVFGSVDVSNNSTTLCGGSVSAIFGGVTLDLRGAVPVDGAMIETNAIFGGIKILAPENCRIHVSGMPFLGGCQCSAQRPNDMSLPLLTIKYTSVFGGVEIR